jgi:hypothetical protein
VRLLTHPPSAGYSQNPISVYYCYGADGGQLERCIAEVTNTPWGERVTFLFRPGGETVPKALHVSPLMDMRSTWRIKASDPRERLFLSVACSHPELGDFFRATFDARLSSAPHLPNETASLGTLWRYGFQPHRVALWIYWHAVVLLWKGVSFYRWADASGGWLWMSLPGCCHSCPSTQPAAAGRYHPHAAPQAPSSRRRQQPRRGTPKPQTGAALCGGMRSPGHGMHHRAQRMRICRR